MKQIKRNGPLFVCLAGVLLCLSGACEHTNLTRPAPPVSLTNAHGAVTQAPQVELTPEMLELVKNSGRVFGPKGDLAANCGLAIAALVLGEMNRRKINKHVEAKQ
jgi:hypothetical protein